jgi:hypothetical protein
MCSSFRYIGDAAFNLRYVNQIRAFLLERGVAVRQGLRFLRARLPRILVTPPEVLSRRMSQSRCRVVPPVRIIAVQYPAVYRDATQSGE